MLVSPLMVSHGIWTCQINRCVYPLDHEGLSRSFTHFTVIAHSQTSKLGLSLRQTDQSHLLDGRCSVSHALSLIKLSNPQVEHPTGHAIRLIRSMGCHLLSHIGTWTVNCQGSPPLLSDLCCQDSDLYVIPLAIA
jgi:hypothetical protein